MIGEGRWGPRWGRDTQRETGKTGLGKKMQLFSKWSRKNIPKKSEQLGKTPILYIPCRCQVCVYIFKENCPGVCLFLF